MSDSAKNPRRGGRAARLVRTSPLAAAAAVYLVVIVAVAIMAPWLAPSDPNQQNLMARLQSYSSEHLLGTDDFGRDVLSRLMFGARTSLFAATQAVAIGLGVGAPLGILAGFRGGRLSALVSWAIDAMMSVPALVSALTIVAILGPGLVNAMFAVGVILIPRFFRIAKAATQDVKGETFIEAAMSLGCSRRRLVGYHLVPNVLSPLVVQVSIVFGTAIAAEASLSFLGLGVRPPTASWGSMLSTAASNMSLAPHLVYAPGVLISLTVLSFAVLGDGLRSALGGTTRGDGDAL